MATTQLRGTQVLDGSVQRSDLDVVTAGQAVVRKLIAGTNVTFSSTGVDAGTGDVTINATGGGAAPGGSNTQLQYNNNGVLAGLPLTYDNSGGSLSYFPTTASGIGGNTVIAGGGSSVAGGGQLTLRGGTASGTGAGGIAQLLGGQGDGSGSGGDVFIRGGLGNGAGAAGGFLQISGGNSTTGVAGDLSLNGGVGATQGGAILLRTGPTNSLTTRFTLSRSGEWLMGGTNPGTTGQVLTSNGTGVAPTWQGISAANITGTLPLANGGTGQTTAQAALNALAGGVTANRVLRANGTNVVLAQVDLAADVTGILPIANGGTGVSALPGAANEILFNGGTGLAAAANTEIDPTSGTLGLVPVSADPATPATNVLLYALDIAGRRMPKWIGPSGLDNPVQPGLFFNQVSLIGPGNATTVGTLNCAVTNVGTIAHPALAATNLKSQTRRFSITSAATAAAFASTRAATTEMWRGNAAGLGGFFVVCRFGVQTLVAGNRGFFGIVQGNAAPTNIDPLADITLAKVGLGFNTNTGNLFLINSSTTAVTTLNLGANFPLSNANMYELILFAPPNGTSISYRVRNLALANSTQVAGSLTTNIPANTTFMSRMAWMTNNATLAAVVWEMSRFGLETDY